MKITDKTISLEAAKLLGTPFKWSWSIPMRFVPTDEGLVVERWRADQGGWTRVYAVPREDDIEFTTNRFQDDDPNIVEGLPDDQAI